MIISIKIHISRYSEEYVSLLQKSQIELITRNSFIRWLCLPNQVQKCYSKPFLENACRLSPWVLMKLVRLNLNLLLPILEDNSLQSHVILLMRDPRAVMHSRKAKVGWCKEPACRNATVLCQQMEDDLETFKAFSKFFPQKLHFLRYEDVFVALRRDRENYVFCWLKF